MRIALSKIFKKPFRLILISIVTFLSALGPADSSAHGQECKKAIRDYRDERIFNTSLKTRGIAGSSSTSTRNTTVVSTTVTIKRTNETRRISTGNRITKMTSRLELVSAKTFDATLPKSSKG